jgi:hypothetical protein
MIKRKLRIHTSLREHAMYLEIHSNFFTAEIVKALKQMEETLATDIVRKASSHPKFQNIGGLHVSPHTLHPFSKSEQKTRGNYDTTFNTYYKSPFIEYLGFASSEWTTRVQAYGDALKQGIAKAAKTRLSTTERELLLAIIQEACHDTYLNPPSHVEEVGPVYVPENAAEPGPSLSYSPVQGMVPILPYDISNYDFEASVPDERQFKFYATLEGQLCYREAWFDSDLTVVSHRGICGARGEARPHSHKTHINARRTYAQLKQAARDEGFKPLPLSKHAKLVVELSLTGIGSPSDLDRRHTLEDYLNELTGVLGLGHVDGGSSGSGTMEVMSYVVNYSIAKVAISEALKDSQFSDFSSIYREPN